jgi:hypothetical protein
LSFLFLSFFFFFILFILIFIVIFYFLHREKQDFVLGKTSMAVGKKDKKSVCFFSNTYTSSMGYYTSKSRKTRFIVTVNNIYNKFMHGVDLADTYLQLHLAKYKHRNWKKLSFLESLSSLWKIAIFYRIFSFLITKYPSLSLLFC